MSEQAWQLVHENERLRDEIARLRGYRDEAEAETAVARLLVDRLRLTDEEREAVHQAAIRVEALCQRGSLQMAATLRGLLERTETVEK